MLYGQDPSGRNVSIFNSLDNVEYRCPACHGILIRKRGNIVQHHFAHKSNRNCDPWYDNAKGDWHIKMQSSFPDDYCEVRVQDNSSDDFHIADVFIPGQQFNYIIEFQHSEISEDDFRKRNDFYIHSSPSGSLHYDFLHNLILNDLFWVFDFRSLIMQKNSLPFYIDIFDSVFPRNLCRAADVSQCLNRFPFPSKAPHYLSSKPFTQFDVKPHYLSKIRVLTSFSKHFCSIFKDLSSHVHILLDVVQRRYLYRQSQDNLFNSNFFDSIDFSYLSSFTVNGKEDDCKLPFGFSDIMYDSFFIYFEPNVLNSLSTDFRSYDGLCIPHSDFFTYFNSFIS